MVDNEKPTEVKEPLCIYEGYLQKGMNIFKEDKKAGMAVIMIALQSIEKYRGPTKVIETIQNFKLENYGIKLNTN